MKITEFSVANFRSIQKAHRIECSTKTIILGKNNEGKSNILRALKCAMDILQSYSDNKKGLIASSKRVHSVLGRRPHFDWDRDYPITLQSQSKLKTEFQIEFELDKKELAAFNKALGLSINGRIGIKMILASDSDLGVSIIKKGPNSKALIKKADEVISYICNALEFIYIPAVRTEAEAHDIVSDMLASRIIEAELKPEYQAALKKIESLQQPIYDSIKKEILASLQQYLPAVKSIEIETPPEYRRRVMRRGAAITLDDGTQTALEYKGDGVKSLITLALIQNRKSKGKSAILAIEEPESHLHPGAIHQLSDTITQISEKSQVILTTHNPLFVDRTEISANVIIANGKAEQAKEIHDIREVLGVLASDNLMAAHMVLVVEGHDDAIALKAILSNKSPVLRKAFANNSLAIDVLTGASKLSYKLQNLRNALTNYYVVLDNDAAGNEAFVKAKNSGLLKVSQITTIQCKGQRESELEDVLQTSLYSQLLLDDYGITLGRTFSGSDKWSTRLAKTFRDQSRPFSDDIKEEIKFKIASLVQDSPTTALNTHQEQSIVSVIDNLEALLSKKSS